MKTLVEECNALLSAATNKVMVVDTVIKNSKEYAISAISGYKLIVTDIDVIDRHVASWLKLQPCGYVKFDYMKPSQVELFKARVIHKVEYELNKFKDFRDEPTFIERYNVAIIKNLIVVKYKTGEPNREYDIQDFNRTMVFPIVEIKDINDFVVYNSLKGFLYI